jgi:hypothetical protein
MIQPLTAPLPPGPFDAMVSALAIHHISDDDKRRLYGRIFGSVSIWVALICESKYPEVRPEECYCEPRAS